MPGSSSTQSTVVGFSGHLSCGIIDRANVVANSRHPECRVLGHPEQNAVRVTRTAIRICTQLGAGKVPMEKWKRDCPPPGSYAARRNACCGPQISDRNQRLLDSVPAFEPGMEKLKVKLSNVHKLATGRPVRSGPQNAGLNGNFVL